MAQDTVAVQDATFKSEVLESAVPVLVDFWATWCAPCRAIAPSLEELATQYKGKVKVAKIDIDANQEVAQQFGIRSIPTLLRLQGRQGGEPDRRRRRQDQARRGAAEGAVGAPAREGGVVLGHVLKHEYEELIARKDWESLRVAFEDVDPADVAEVLWDLPPEDSGVIFRLLPRSVSARGLRAAAARSADRARQGAGHRAAGHGAQRDGAGRSHPPVRGAAGRGHQARHHPAQPRGAEGRAQAAGLPGGQRRPRDDAGVPGAQAVHDRGRGAGLRAAARQGARDPERALPGRRRRACCWPTSAWPSW